MTTYDPLKSALCPKCQHTESTPGCDCGHCDCLKPVGADLSDVLIQGDDVAVGAFRITHEPCGATLLFTQRVHMDTLVRIAAEHDCAEPDPDWNPVPVTQGVWRHLDGTKCASYPDSFNWTFVVDSLICGHGQTIECHPKEV